MKEIEAKKKQEVQKDAVKKLGKVKKETDIPRLTADFLDQTLQIA